MPKPKGMHKKSKGKGNSGDTTVSSSFQSFSKNHLPFAPIFRTKMCCTYAGTLPSGTAANGYFYVSGNSMHVPFNSTEVAATRSINYYSATGYSGESYSTVQPAGFSAICGSAAPYAFYRVHAAKLKLAFRPTSTADNIMTVISGNQSGQQSTTTVWTAASAPYSSALRTFTSIEQDHYLSKRLSTSQLYSVPDKAIRTGDAWIGGYNSSPANEWAFVIQWQNVDNTTTNAIMGISIQLEYDVEFIQPNCGGLPDLYMNKKSLEISTSSKDDVQEADFDLVLKGECYKKVVESTPSRAGSRK
jgi:hypothetical protein